MTPCSNTTVSIPSPQESLCKNDNSNPQQGTGLPPLTVDMDPPKVQMKAGNEGNTNIRNNNNNNNNAMRSPPNKKDSRKLFVGGLPADVTEEEFRVFFEQFGEVVDSVVMFDRETHRSRGFGFVTFQSSEVANRLLDMGQTEDESGVAAKSEDSTRAPRVGRLVMRGKTCEVKAAEPKESSRSHRRFYQNQGGSSTSTAAPARRFVEKSFSQSFSQPPSGHATPTPGGAPHATTPYHDPHFMAANHYPMVSPSYYPAYHPGMYHGGGGYHHPAPMYAPVAHAAAATAQPVQVHNDGLHHPHHPYVPPVIATPVDTAHGGAPPYMDVAVAAAAVHEHGHGHGHSHGHGYTAAAAYGHPQMMQHQAYHPHHPSQAAMHPQAPPKPVANAHPLPTAYPAPGTPASVMHLAAPGLPNQG